jgi:alpha-beta hydrolase superfamily lysophospholipase
VTSLFDTDEFNQRLFFPRPDDRPPPEGARDLHVPSGDGATLRVRVHAAPAARTVLAFLGNGEVASDYDALAPRFAAIGLALAAADYRGYGTSTGTPSLRAAQNDARVVLDAICRELGQRVVVLGRSLGSACANEIFARDVAGVAGVVVESGYAELSGLVQRRGLKVPPKFREADLAAFDPLRKLARGHAPLLVVHGADDDVISAREAERAYAAATTATKRLVIVPDRGHNDLFGAPAYWEALRAFAAALPA